VAIAELNEPAPGFFNVAGKGFAALRRSPPFDRLQLVHIIVAEGVDHSAGINTKTLLLLCRADCRQRPVRSVLTGILSS
jgi:hypothetical protein